MTKSCDVSGGVRVRWNAPKAYVPIMSRTRLIITIVFAGLVFAFVTFALVIESQLREPLKIWAETRVTNLATITIAKAAESALSAGLGDVDLIRPLKGTGGVTGLSYAWADLLHIKVVVTEAIVKAVESMTNETIPVPFGELSGISFFAAHGPTIPVRIVPLGAVTTDMRFDFMSKGINQVLHRVYVDVQVRMRVVAPFTGTDVTVHEQIPVTTELIQGVVPSAILNWSGSMEELRSSVPTQ